MRYVAAVLVLVLVLVGCGPSVLPPVDFNPDLTIFVTPTERPDLTGGTSDAGGWFCLYDRRDGGVRLLPGSPCELHDDASCARIERCSIEWSEAHSYCLEVPDSDRGVSSRCCAYFSTHNMADGTLEIYRNCGAGFSCVTGC